MPQARITDISHLPIFNQINSSDCTLLFECLGGRIRRYKKDEHILLRRELVGNMGILIDGSVNIYKEDIWGNRALISYLKEGGVFGENLPIDSEEVTYGNHNVSFISTSPSLVLFLPIRRILLMDKIGIISNGSVREKILSYLSMEAQRQKSSIIRIPLSRTELAEYLCVNRSALSRELSALKNEGLLDFRKDLFEIYSAKDV